MKKKVKFLKSPTGAFRLGYGIGEIAEIEEKQAETLIEGGFATDKLEEAEENDLPEDLPFRAVLIKADVTSYDEVKKYASDGKLVDLKGIGEPSAKAINEYLAAQE